MQGWIGINGKGSLSRLSCEDLKALMGGSAAPRARFWSPSWEFLDSGDFWEALLGGLLGDSGGLLRIPETPMAVTSFYNIERKEFITWIASGGNGGSVGWLPQLGMIGQVSTISILHTQRMLLRMLGEDTMQKTISRRGTRFSLNSGQSQGLFFSRIVRLDFPRINWNQKQIHVL